MNDRRPTSELLRIVFALLAIWIMFAFFNASEFYRRSHAVGAMLDWAPIVVFQIQSSLVWAWFTPIVVFIAERLPIRDRHWLRNLLVLCAMTPVLAVVRAAIGGAWLRIAEGKPVTLAFIELSIAVRFHRNVFLLFVIIGITNILLAYRRSVMRERDAFSLQEAVTKASLAQLRARMLPRVMFDSLLAISDRAPRDPGGADRMIVDLSELLRNTLTLDRRTEVTLAEELEHIDRYLDVEKARAEGKLATRIDFEEPLLGARVPPLVVHTLVEHALAGSLPPGQRTLSIAGHAEGDRLCIEIRRNGSAPATTLGEMREQLEALLSEKLSLDRRRDGADDVVTVELPLHFAEGAS